VLAYLIFILSRHQFMEIEHEMTDRWWTKRFHLITIMSVWIL